MRGDDRGAIAGEIAGVGARGGANVGAWIEQRPASKKHRAEEARDAARERHRRRMEEKRAAADEGERQQVFGEHEPHIGAVMKARAHQRRAIVEEPVRDRRQQREQNEAAWKSSGGPISA